MKPTVLSVRRFSSRGRQHIAAVGSSEAHREGEVVLAGQDLNQALASDRWRWLGDLLAEQLMGLTPLRSLVIDNDQLVLTADVITGKDPVKRSFRLCADQGTIRVDHCDAEESMLLPMDPNIQINAARLQGGQLVLSGQATVQP